MAHESNQGTKTSLKSSKLYDTIKLQALVVLPSLGTLYFTLSQIWGLPAAAEVVGSITAVDTFLGVTLHISNANYLKNESNYDGVVNVTETADKKKIDLQFNGDPNEIDKQQSVTFKVNSPK